MVFMVNADLICARAGMRACVHTCVYARAHVCVIVIVFRSKCSLGGLNSQFVQRKAFYHRNKQGYNHVSMPTVGLQRQMVGPNQVECSRFGAAFPRIPDQY